MSIPMIMDGKEQSSNISLQSQHDDAIIVKPENALNRRIRRMVRMLIAKDKAELQKPAICRLYRTVWQDWMKLMVGVLCSVIFLYQAYERVTYYLSVPVIVDVSIVGQEILKFPAVTVCFPNFGQLTNLLLTADQRAKLSSCDEETNITGQQVMNRSNINYWKGRTDVNATWITARLKPYLPVKLQKVIILPQGVCTTFYSDSSVKFQGSRQSFNFDFEEITIHCKAELNPMFCVHHPGEDPDHKDFVSILGYRGADFGLSITKYTFLNRQKKPCSSVRNYWECFDKCLTRELPKRLACRYHYLSPELPNFPLCSRKLKPLTTLSLMSFLDRDKTCKCIPPCERSMFNMNYRPRPTTERILRLSLFFEDNYITSFEERYAYGFIALLCDVGGIMGLYLGWSLLSVCSLLHGTFFRTNDSVVHSQNIDPIYMKVCKDYDRLKKRNTKIFLKQLDKGNNCSASSSVQSHFKYFRYLILLLCGTGCLYISYDRFTIYLSIPVTTIVEIKHRTKVEFPIFTYCKDNNATIQYKQKIATSQNLSSFCEVDFLQILDIPGISVSKLWELSFTNANITENVRHSPRRTQILGESCVAVNIGKEVHFGRNIFKTMAITPQCNGSLKIYITPPGSEFDFSHYYTISNRVFYTRLLFKIQERQVSPLLTNCLNDREAKECKENCLTKRMVSKLKCRLPLMPDEYKVVPMCTSSTTAKEARSTYIDILTTTDAANDCHCQRPCRKIIFESDILVIPGKSKGYPRVSPRAGYLEADQQIFTEIPRYPTSKLLCDIGGILGLLLGFSFIDSVCFVIRVISTRLKLFLWH